MKMVAHKTESIYRRYAIVDETMLKERAPLVEFLPGFRPKPMAPMDPKHEPRAGGAPEAPDLLKWRQTPARRGR